MQTIHHTEHDYVTQDSSSYVLTMDTSENFSQTPNSSSPKRKRMRKTTRLSRSLKNNEHFLKINEGKATIDKNIKKHKLK